MARNILNDGENQLKINALSMKGHSPLRLADPV